MIRMMPPQVASLINKVGSYTAAAAFFQTALYKCTGTFKHMLQTEEGCTIAACLGMPPFEHSEVGCSLAGVTAAVEVRPSRSSGDGRLRKLARPMLLQLARPFVDLSLTFRWLTHVQVRAELKKLGIDSHAAVLTGKVWIGSAGNEVRREYVMIGEPMQLGLQMLTFATAEFPIVVDGPTSQANKARFNFSVLPVRATPHPPPHAQRYHGIVRWAPYTFTRLCALLVGLAGDAAPARPDEEACDAGHQGEATE